MGQIWQELFAESFRETMHGIAVFLPRIMVMLMLFVIGVLVGWIVKVLLLRVLRTLRLDAVSERLGLALALQRAGIKRSASQLVGLTAFWLIFLFFGFVGLNVLAVTAATEVVRLILQYLPHLLAALLVLLTGWLLANFLAQAALIAAVNAQFFGARFLAAAVRWGVLSLTLAMVLTQLGIAKEVVVAAFSIAFGGVVLALALAFGLGAKEHAKKFLDRSLEEQPDHQDHISHL
ncbi:MAG: hypothetical protein E6K67_05360 [Nitrospirae bacterium]|nr:MAG: hypothetical protein E6K67_05360 [Nitrospirota bacterium]